MRGYATVVSLAALVSVDARVFKGTCTGSTLEVFAGAFAFGVDRTGAPVGTVSIDWQTTDTWLTGFLSNDTVWTQLYGHPYSNSDSGDVSCPDNLSLAQFRLPLPAVDGTGSIQMPIFEVDRPRMWYLQLANIVDGLYCGTSPTGTFTATFLQADGSQLSYDERGLPGIFAAYFALFIVLGALHAWLHYYPRPPFAPTLVLIASASLGLTVFGLLLQLIDAGSLARDGEGVPGAGYVGYFFRLVSQMGVWMLATLTACGYGIVSYNLRDRKNFLPFLLQVIVMIAYIALAVWYGESRKPSDPNNAEVSAWPVILLLVITIGYMLWFIWRINALRRQPAVQQDSTGAKPRLLRILGIALGLHFAIAPVSEIIGAVSPDYDRVRNATIIDYLLSLATWVAIVYALWPAKAAPAFTVADGTKPYLPEGLPESHYVSLETTAATALTTPQAAPFSPAAAKSHPVFSPGYVAPSETAALLEV